MNHISQDPSLRGALALGSALGTHLTVTHSSLDHRGQTLRARYWPLRPCNGHWSVCWDGGRAIGDVEMCVTLQSLSNLLRRVPMGVLELSEI